MWGPAAWGPGGRGGVREPALLFFERGGERGEFGEVEIGGACVGDDLVCVLLGIVDPRDASWLRISGLGLRVWGPCATPADEWNGHLDVFSWTAPLRCVTYGQGAGAWGGPAPLTSAGGISLICLSTYFSQSHEPSTTFSPAPSPTWPWCSAERGGALRLSFGALRLSFGALRVSLELPFNCSGASEWSPALGAGCALLETLPAVLTGPPVVACAFGGASARGARRAAGPPGATTRLRCIFACW